jgi:hypothetical protein
MPGHAAIDAPENTENERTLAKPDQDETGMVESKGNVEQDTQDQSQKTGMEEE